MSEFKLIDKIGTIGNAEYFHCEGQEPTLDYEEVIQLKDVKEFVRLLKLKICSCTEEDEDICVCCKRKFEIINKLTGFEEEGK